jgi:uncharacterized membrane protein YdbT with pleckstrin-like domain
MSAKDRLKESMAARKEAMKNDDDLEEDIWEGTYSPKDMYGWWIAAGIGSVAAVVLAIVLAIYGAMPGWGWGVLVGLILLTWAWLTFSLYWARWGAYYKLTSQRLIHRAGVIKQRTDRIEVIDMDDITYEQSIVQRMFDVGDVIIVSSDRTDPELRLRGISNCQEVAKLMDAARRRERVRRGIHIGAV